MSIMSCTFNVFLRIFPPARLFRPTRLFGTLDYLGFFSKDNRYFQVLHLFLAYVYSTLQSRYLSPGNPCSNYLDTFFIYPHTWQKIISIKYAQSSTKELMRHMYNFSAFIYLGTYLNVAQSQICFYVFWKKISKEDVKSLS